jgi:hypothetical protein
VVELTALVEDAGKTKELLQTAEDLLLELREGLEGEWTNEDRRYVVERLLQGGTLYEDRIVLRYGFEAIEHPVGSTNSTSTGCSPPVIRP